MKSFEELGVSPLIRRAIEDGVSVVVSAGEDGLQTEDIAKITDIVKQETELTADCIKILEVN